MSGTQRLRNSKRQAAAGSGPKPMSGPKPPSADVNAQPKPNKKQPQPRLT